MMQNKQESTKQYENLNGIIKINQSEIHYHLDTVVRDTVEETLNKLLDAEADQLCKAAKYERTDKRTTTRAGALPTSF